VARYAQGRRVLDVFCYTGGFAQACLAGRAKSALLIDSSETSLELAGLDLAHHGFDKWAERIRADAFDALRALADEGERFDLVILDPPKLLAPGADRASAERAYRKLQAMGMRLVEPGGLLATFSCSGAMDRARFDQVVFEAAGARPCRVLERFTQPADHPVILSFRKSEYLKGLLLHLE
jgi:23S rRNA (cytosine1962-C5)-methyltransferase